MATQRMTREMMQEAVDYLAAHKTIAGSARALGIPRNTFAHRIAKAEAEGVKPNATPPGEPFVAADPADEDMPIEDYLNFRQKAFEKKLRASRANRWRDVQVKMDGPIGLMWLGDPHIDDNGCDLPTLRRHLSIIQSSDAIRGCSMGDNQNAWVGRMAHLWAHQDTSQHTANRMVEWLIREMDPIVLIGGNHDMWLGSGDPVTWMSRHANVVFQNWRADVCFKFPNGRDCRVVAAHDLPGHSQWNDLHALMKSAKGWGPAADVYLCGHKHIWGTQQVELPERDGRNVVWLGRCRGYKFFDSYAERLGLPEQQNGQALLQIIDPEAERPTGFVSLFSDVDHGADYLGWLREKRGHGKQRRLA